MSAGVKLSAAPIDWGVAELVRGNPDPIELLDWVTAAGYTGCELGTHGYFGFTSDAILELFRPRGLAVSASWYDVDLSQPLLASQATEIDQICSFLEAGGANVINISDKIVDARAAVVGRVPSFPETWWPDEAWKQVPETLLQIHEVTARRGITVAFHQHVATHIESDREMRLLIEAVQGTPIRFCIDSGHLTLGGSDPVALVAELGDAVVHIHAKDVDGPMLARLQSGEVDYFAATGQGLYSDLGTGIVDWTGLRDGLVKAGFGGWVVAEQDRLLVPNSRIPFDANKRNFAFLAGLFRLN